VFRGFWQAKLAYGGSTLDLSQFTLLHAPTASKNDACFKSGQKDTQN